MYEHVFFDLDRTLWDMDKNSYETLLELFEKHDLSKRGIVDFNLFLSQYKIINDNLWDEYRREVITKETLRYKRFRDTFMLHDVNDELLVTSFGNDYVNLSPIKNNLIPHTFEVLEYLNKKYTLHIITNGFEEVQHIKMKNSGIENYFKEIITSERAGCKKPDPRIFNFSIQAASAKHANSIMIGDSLETDIIGAREVGIKQVYFNPYQEKHQEVVTHEISSLKELMVIL